MKRVLYIFLPSKPFSMLLQISQENHIFLKILNSDLQAIEVWFTGQNKQPLVNNFNYSN